MIRSMQLFIALTCASFALFGCKQHSKPLQPASTSENTRAMSSSRVFAQSHACSYCYYNCRRNQTGCEMKCEGYLVTLPTPEMGSDFPLDKYTNCYGACLDSRMRCDEGCNRRCSGTGDPAR